MSTIVNLSLLISLVLAQLLSLTSAVTTFSGNQIITTHIYTPESVGNSYPFCGYPYDLLDLSRITAVEAMVSDGCGACLQVCSCDTGRCAYVLAVDMGGRGLDVSQGTYGQIMPDNISPSCATWSTVDDSFCQGIWKGAQPLPKQQVTDPASLRAGGSYSRSATTTSTTPVITPTTTAAAAVTTTSSPVSTPVQQPPVQQQPQPQPQGNSDRPQQQQQQQPAPQQQDSNQFGTFSVPEEEPNTAVVNDNSSNDNVVNNDNAPSTASNSFPDFTFSNNTHRCQVHFETVTFINYNTCPDHTFNVTVATDDFKSDNSSDFVFVNFLDNTASTYFFQINDQSTNYTLVSEELNQLIKSEHSSLPATELCYDFTNSTLQSSPVAQCILTETIASTEKMSECMTTESVLESGNGVSLCSEFASADLVQDLLNKCFETKSGLKKRGLDFERVAYSRVARALLKV